METSKISDWSMYNIRTIAEYLLEDWNNKKIIDVGCGSSLKINVRKEYFPNLINFFNRRPASKKLIHSKKDLTLIGFDIGFLNKSEDYLKEFEKKFNFKPIGGHIYSIDSILEDKFDFVMSSCFFGYPTSNLDLELIMSKLYKITKKEGYHYHFKIDHESFDLSKKAIEDIGFKVLYYFKEGGIGSSLILKKDKSLSYKS